MHGYIESKEVDWSATFTWRDGIRIHVPSLDNQLIDVLITAVSRVIQSEESCRHTTDHHSILPSFSLCLVSCSISSSDSLTNGRRSWCIGILGEIATMATHTTPSSTLELPPPLDFSHHFSEVTKRRNASKIKQFYKYFSIPGIGNLAGGGLCSGWLVQYNKSLTLMHRSTTSILFSV